MLFFFLFIICIQIYADTVTNAFEFRCNSLFDEMKVESIAVHV